MNQMMSKTLVVILAATIFLSCNRGSEAPKSPLVSYADSLFQTSVDKAFIAGASVIVYQNGKELLNKTYGFASIELQAPMPENPSFEIGSVTKQFTAAAILRLVEDGKLSLEDDFTQYMEFDTKGRVVTVGHLLNHTSGIDSYTEISGFGDLAVHDYERDSLVRLVEQQNFLFEPGEALIYNNSAFFFLGLIIEKVSGMSYEDYLKEAFFTPLGMSNTYYCSTSEVVAGKVYGYGYSGDGLRQKQFIEHTWPYAAGSLCSTTEDLLIWMKALHGGKIFGTDSYQKMITPGTLSDGTGVRYAMGLTNYSNFGNQEIGHGGGIPGFLSQTTYFPESDLYLICLVNTTGPKGAPYFVEELTWRILEKQQYVKMELDIDKSSLAGTYSGQARGQQITLTIEEVADGITLLNESESEPDTLDIYVGNSTWMDGNSTVQFRDSELHIDQRYNHYVLSKE